MFRQYGAGKRFDFTESNGFKSARAFKPKGKSSNTAE
jgi:ribosomal protein L35